jgi:hypothetical protein
VNTKTIRLRLQAELDIMWDVNNPSKNPYKEDLLKNLTKLRPPPQGYVVYPSDPNHYTANLRILSATELEPRDESELKAPICSATHSFAEDPPGTFSTCTREFGHTGSHENDRGQWWSTITGDESDPPLNPSQGPHPEPFAADLGDAATTWHNYAGDRLRGESNWYANFIQGFMHGRGWTLERRRETMEEAVAYKANNALTPRNGSWAFEVLANALQCGTEPQVIINTVRELRNRLHTAEHKVKESDEPIPMILHCPSCHVRHIDTVYSPKIHHSHACQHCGAVWRPAKVATVGVQFLPGFKDP